LRNSWTVSDLHDTGEHDLCCPRVGFAAQLIGAQHGDHEMGTSMVVVD
jgi:hypothetical protein